MEGEKEVFTVKSIRSGKLCIHDMNSGITNLFQEKHEFRSNSSVLVEMYTELQSELKMYLTTWQIDN